MINITVTADDFGYCEMRNKGILELCKKGIIHSISLLVNATDSIAAVSAFHQLPIDIKSNISVGLHLNLTEGKPVSERSSIPSLLNDAGNFLGKMEVRKKLDDLLNDELGKEITSQINKFKELMGYLPKYVDGHQHVHVCYKIRDVLSHILYSFGIKKTRIPFELGLNRCLWIGSSQCFLESVCEDACAAKQVYDARNVKSSDFFMGLSTMGKNMTYSNVRSALEKVIETSSIKNVVVDSSKNLKVEFMVHPGYKSQVGLGGCGLGPDEFSLSDERETELNFLQNEFSKVLLHLNLRLA